MRRTICDKRPEQLKMEFALWTRGAVMQFVEREFGVRLSILPTRRVSTWEGRATGWQYPGTVAMTRYARSAR